MENINKYEQYMYSYPHKRAYHFTEKLDLSRFRNRFVDKEMSLYFHIPFCHAKCGFCNLFSLTGIKKEDFKEYINAVQKHSLQMREEIDFSKTNFSSLIFGGGTPLILNVKELKNIFDIAINDFKISSKEVFSVIESSPTEITDEKLDFLEEYFFKRVSLGIQSFSEEELRLIERIETVKGNHRALEMLKNRNFPILNLDLIYGIPNQSESSFLYSLEQALQYEPEEIFLYPLYKQINARLYNKFEIDQDKQYNLYLLGSSYLKSKGYTQMSMRNFTKIAKNDIDCGFENTLSLGCGGRSYFENLHFCEKYVSDKNSCFKEYFDYLNKKNFLENISFYELSKEEIKRRYVIKNLLYKTGLSKLKYQEYFNSEINIDFPIFNFLFEKKYIEERENKIFLTELGLSLSDYIGPMFISKEIKERMKNYD